MTESLNPEIVSLFKALADETRIQVAALLIQGPRTVDDLARALHLAPNLVRRHLARLEEVGLAEVDTERQYRFHRRPLLDALQGLAERSPEPGLEGETEEDRKVLAGFFSGGRLKTIPVQQKKREVVLRHLAQRFEFETLYTEREVNAILREFHEDTASLRRFLVDDGMLCRQVVRVVDPEELREGSPSVEHRLTYWRPGQPD